jgi:multidrug efflux system outer membrane protein
MITSISLWFSSCKVPAALRKTENKTVPASYGKSEDSTNTAKVKWNQFFKDPNLKSLIDTALRNNQELNIIVQEINISRNEVKARKGAYLPFVDFHAGAGVDKVGRYTRLGAVDANTEIKPGRRIPDPYGNFIIGPTVSWQVDIWKQLRNSRKAAWFKYLSTTAGKNFMVTNLVAEMANSYFELMALDNQLDILKQNIAIQQNALEIVKQEKTAARVTELAVRRFEAEVAKNQSRQFYIKQQITETENRINFLAGRFPQPVVRSSQTFSDLVPDSIQAGIPFQLLENRPDIKQAELDLAASKLDVKVAKANFYPSLFITGGVGLEAFNPAFLVKAPESILMYLAGDLVAPLINRNAIKANYWSANSRQVQSVYNYERAILRGYIEVANQLSNINNLENSYKLKSQQVQALTRSIEISTGLFKSARADYMEVLLTQRDAMESRFELIETKKQQMNAMVNVYQALGGGW